MKANAITSFLLLCPNAAPAGDPVSVRMLDLNGDGLRDRLEIAADGALSIALNRGQRFFERIPQDLPRTHVTDVLIGDLDRDGHADLYLVSAGPKVALRGDGSGCFLDATVELGLGDEGIGLSAEHEDLDGDGFADVLLHDVGGDVVFWGLANGAFERDPDTRPLVAPSPTIASGVTIPPAAASLAPAVDARDAARTSPGRAPAVTAAASSATDPGSTSLPLVPTTVCPQSIEDQSTGDCLRADSTPTLGSLYPLGPELNIQSGTGRVGIGTLAPTHQLTVAGAIRSTDRVHAALGSSTNPTYRFGSGAEAAGFASPSFNAIAMVTNALERLRITSAGDVGIGTAAPTAKLDVNGNARAVQLDAQFVRGDNSAGSPGIYGRNWGSGSAANFLCGPAANTADGVTIDSFGSGDGLRVFTVGAELRGISSTAMGALTYGIYGESPNIGVVGRTISPQSVAILSQGNFVAAGSKAFSAPHPTDPSLELRFACLEGNESGTYFRGSAQLVHGRAVVRVPEEFRLASAPANLSAQLTPVGAPARLWVESQDLECLVVRGDVDVEFHYVVNGERRGYADHVAIQPNKVWRPEYRGEPFGSQYPDEIRRMLVENGTLNPDFTPNETTAGRLGWTLKERETPSAPPRPVEPETPSHASDDGPRVEPASEDHTRSEPPEPERN